MSYGWYFLDVLLEGFPKRLTLYYPLGRDYMLLAVSITGLVSHLDLVISVGRTLCDMNNVEVSWSMPIWHTALADWLSPSTTKQSELCHGSLYPFQTSTRLGSERQGIHNSDEIIQEEGCSSNETHQKVLQGPRSWPRCCLWRYFMLEDSGGWIWANSATYVRMRSTGDAGERATDISK